MLPRKKRGIRPDRINEGLKRSQQLFSDLNLHAIRPTKSIGILYDHREPLSRLTRDVIEKVPVFNGLTEKEKSSISNRSTKLFTLSSIHNATKVLLNRRSKNSLITKGDKEKAITFWLSVTDNISQWKAVKAREVSSSSLREEYVHAHGVALQALGNVGRDITRKYPKKWQDFLEGLDQIDWSRDNATLWEGNALINGRVSKSVDSVKRTSIVIKKELSIPLMKDEINYMNGQLQ